MAENNLSILTRALKSNTFLHISILSTDCKNVLTLSLNWLYCHVFMVRLETGFGLVIEFTEHLQMVTTSNYNALANSCTIQFTTARTKPSQSAVFSSRCLVATSNGRRSPYSGFPKYPRASATSFYEQRLITELQQFSK
jgi:hypothetical protein